MLSVVAFAAIIVVQPPTLKGHPEVETSAAAPVRQVRGVDWTMPAARKTAWAAFTAEAGADWQVYWDAETQVPGRIFGAGIPAPGVMASDAAAERFARAFLSRHIDLLAPGSQPTDFVLASNRVDDGMRTVGFYQYHAGLRVLDGQVSFRFKNDHLFVIGSEALPDVVTHVARAAADPTRARGLAQAWIGDDFGTQSVVTDDDTQPVIVAMVRGRGAIEYRVVTRVTVDAPDVPGRFTVYLDAETGTPVARKQTLRFATGTVRYNVPDRWYASTREDQPAARANLTVNGAQVQTGVDGTFTFTTSPATVVTALSGPIVTVQNAAGGLSSTTLTIADGGTGVWNVSQTEFDDAELTAFIATQVAKRWIKGVDPAFTWADGNSSAQVNVNQTCNANSDGNNTHFFRAGMDSSGTLNCANTGRITDVIYHETGHSMHSHTIIPGVGSEGDGSLGEGQADYVAMTITNDHGMGRGFFIGNDMALRDSDPPDHEYSWPQDVGEIHDTGMIFSGAMWDLRKALITKLGMTAGVAKSDHLFHEALRRAVDIPSTYTEILAADDDDGNLANGTPNMCEINAAFAPHGLVPPTGDIGVIITAPTREGFKINLRAQASQTCHLTTVQSVLLQYQVRGMPSTVGMADMTASGDTYSADIPMQPSGTVMNYWVTVTLANGTVYHYPDNLADPMYEFFVGDVVPLYCTDFEGSAEPAGWTHGVTKGTRDQWKWGPLMTMASSPDPTTAFSGTSVYGQDLGGATDNGDYVASTTSFLKSPMIDTLGYTNVRLQYRRWLTCEQGYYDHATIYGNGTKLWTNIADGMNGNKHMLDKEWRFQDVDLSSTVQNNYMTVTFELASDQGLQFGGWTIDDFCVVGYLAPGEPPPTCGNGTIDPGEECDDGNMADGDGCNHLCKKEMAPPNNGTGSSDSGCGCQVGKRTPAPSAILFIGALIWLARGRRRRAAARSAESPAPSVH